MIDKLFGNYPFPPDQKRPYHIKGDAIKPYIAPADNIYQSDLNMLYASSDKLSVGIFQLAPGSSYDPADVHEGDEAYYILDGILTIQNPVTGECVQIRKGEGLLMPMYGYHKGYNFEQSEARILFAIAPKVQPGNVTPVDFSNGRMKQYKGSYNSSFPYISPQNQNLPHGTIDLIGNWPVSGPESRKDPIMFYHIPDSKKLISVHGTKHPMLIKFIVSNDLIHMGEFILPSGGSACRASEPDSHKGDCVLYVETGTAAIYLTASQETFNVKPGEAFFLPENTEYQIFNYTGNTVKLIFSISPEL